MRTPQLATHFIRVVAVPLLLAGAAAGAAPAMAAAQSGPPSPMTSFPDGSRARRPPYRDNLPASDE